MPLRRSDEVGARGAAEANPPRCGVNVEEDVTQEDAANDGALLPVFRVNADAKDGVTTLVHEHVVPRREIKGTAVLEIEGERGESRETSSLLWQLEAFVGPLVHPAHLARHIGHPLRDRPQYVTVQRPASMHARTPN